MDFIFQCMYMYMFLCFSFSLFSPLDSLGGKSVEQSPSTPVTNDPEEEDGGRIVPQLKIGADGTIQIDEDRYSLIISIGRIIVKMKYMYLVL